MSPGTYIFNTDFFVNGQFICSTTDRQRDEAIKSILSINKGVKAQFLTKFSTPELVKYNNRLIELVA